MRNIFYKTYLILLLLFILTSKLNAQLNKFLVQTYFNEKFIDNYSLIPNVQEYFNILSNTYYFNSIFLDKTIGFPDEYYIYAKEAGLMTIHTKHNPLIIGDYNALLSNNIDYHSIFDKYSSSNFNVIGYNFGDEPYLQNDPVKPLDHVPPFLDELRKYNPNLLRYVNLHPQKWHSFWDTEWEDRVYLEDYIQWYITHAKPNLLSFDEYPLWGDDYDHNFFKALYDYGMKSTINSIPFLYVLTPIDHIDQFRNGLDYLNNRAPASFKKIRFCINAALAYGAKGISYWPGFDLIATDDNVNYKMSYDIEETEAIFALHKKLIDNSSLLLSLNFVSAYHKEDPTYDLLRLPTNYDLYEFNKWSKFKDDKYTINIFNDPSNPFASTAPSTLVVTYMTNQNDYAGLVYPTVYTWFFNKSINNTISFNVKLKSNIKLYNCFDNTYETNITLLPGEAKLYRVDNNSAYPTMPNFTFVNGVGKNGIAEITVGNTINISNVKMSDGYIKSFMGRTIRLRPGDNPNTSGINNDGQTKISGSTGSIVRLKAYTDCNEIANTSSSSNAPRSKEVSELTYLPKTDLMIYPNPVNQGQNVFIKSSNPDDTSSILKIFDVSGKYIIEYIFENNFENKISTLNLEKGIYILVFGDKRYKLFVQ